MTPLERAKLIARAIEMRATGLQVQEIANMLGIDRRTITYWVNPESADKSRARARAATREGRRAAQKREREEMKVGHIAHVASAKPPLADSLARLAEIPFDDRTPAQRLMGDPPAARSALKRCHGRLSG